jgi:16S rRNA (guanine527-N7)-methyltransferase
MGVLAETLLMGAPALGIELTVEQLGRFEEFYRLLLETNKSLNLTSIVEEREVAIKHFLDSLTCFSAVSFDDGMTLMDIGAGAGFPGIPLKICRPGLLVTLVESLEKRVSFLKKAVAELCLQDVEALHARAEDIGRDSRHREKYNRVTARAVAPLGILAEYCLPVVKEGGYFIAMKGPRLEDELAAAGKAIEILGGEVEKVINLRLPLAGDERSLVLIRKKKPTPDKYPRRAGMPQKKPL